MAIAFDASSNGAVAASGTITVSHTCSGSNRALVLGICSGSDAVTSVQYAGVAMTQVGKVQISGGSNFGYLYYLPNPASGANNVVITGTNAMAYVGASYMGVNQGAAVDASLTVVQPGTSSTSLTESITTVADNCWTLIYSGLQRAVTAGAGTTSRGTDTQWSTMLGDSNGVVHPAGSNSMTINFSSSIAQGCLMLSLAPAVSGISFDNALADSVGTGGAATVSYTTGPGSNRYLAVGVTIQNNQTCTGVTYGGVAMSQLTTINSSNVSPGETSYVFGLANPATGTNNIVASFSGSGNYGVAASSYLNAQQANAVEASNTGTGASGTASVSVTTLTNNDWLVGYARAQSSSTAAAGTVIRGIFANINMMDSNADKTPAGSYSLSFTTASNDNFASQVIALKPVSTVTPTYGAFLLKMV